MHDGTVKVGDLGVAKELPTMSALASTFAGTPAFMSPEALRNERYNSKVRYNY